MINSIAEFAKIGVRKFAPGDAIAMGALIELQQGGENIIYYLGPRAGGTEVIHDKKEILVITPQSPLGEQLAGKKAGELPQIKLGGELRSVKILSVE